MIRYYSNYLLSSSSVIYIICYYYTTLSISHINILQPYSRFLASFISLLHIMPLLISTQLLSFISVHRSYHTITFPPFSIPTIRIVLYPLPCSMHYNVVSIKLQSIHHISFPPYHHSHAISRPITYYIHAINILNLVDI